MKTWTAPPTARPCCDSGPSKRRAKLRLRRRVNIRISPPRRREKSSSLFYFLTSFSRRTRRLGGRQTSSLFHAVQQLLLRVARRLIPPSQIFRQKLLRRGIERHFVFGPGEAMPFVGEDEVFDGLVVLAHGRDDLVALRLVDARIVRPLANQQRRLDLVGFEKRRLRFQNLF